MDSNPLNGGLFSWLTVDDVIDSALWNRANAGHEIVGECRLCGGHLTPAGTSYLAGRVEWFEARCVQCGHMVAAPGGRTLRRSGRASEQPPGWWEAREKAMDQ